MCVVVGGVVIGVADAGVAVIRGGVAAGVAVPAAGVDVVDVVLTSTGFLVVVLLSSLLVSVSWCALLHCWYVVVVTVVLVVEDLRRLNRDVSRLKLAMRCC